MREPSDEDLRKGDEAFKRAYDEHTKGFNIHCTADSEAEAYFSWSSCDTCGCTLGGDREDMILTNAGTTKGGRRHKAIKVVSCMDCLMYSANGTLPSESGIVWCKGGR